MEMALLVARLLLAVVFAVAGLVKLWDSAGSRQALSDFGVPAGLARPLGLLLPLVELAVAGTLFFTVTAWWGALGALTLLLIFMAGMSYNLLRGRQPACQCFGQLHSAPIGWSTLVRDVLLAAIAGFIVGFGRTTTGLSAVDLPGALTLAQLLGLIGGVFVVGLLAFESWALFQVLHQQGRLLLRLEKLEEQLAGDGALPLLAPIAGESTAQIGLPVGTAAPSFDLADLDGEKRTLDGLCALGKPVLLLFSDPDCGPCMTLMLEIERWQRVFSNIFTFVLISRGTLEANRARASQYDIGAVLVQEDHEVAQAYQAIATPSAVLVFPNGAIGSPLVEGTDAILSFMKSVVHRPNQKSLPVVAGNNHGHIHAATPEKLSILKVGKLAPEFTLPDLTGKPVALADFRGSSTLVLFWNPNCGFCQQMLKDLNTLEARRARHILIVSRGTVEANEALGLSSPVVLDEGFTVGAQFGATGTPQAVLIDAQGVVISEVAAGASAVLALARRVPTTTRTAGKTH